MDQIISIQKIIFGYVYIQVTSVTNYCTNYTGTSVPAWGLQTSGYEFSEGTPFLPTLTHVSSLAGAILWHLNMMPLNFFSYRSQSFFLIFQLLKCPECTVYGCFACIGTQKENMFVLHIHYKQVFWDWRNSINATLKCMQFYAHHVYKRRFSK